MGAVCALGMRCAPKFKTSDLEVLFLDSCSVAGIFLVTARARCDHRAATPPPSHGQEKQDSGCCRPPSTPHNRAGEIF